MKCPNCQGLYPKCIDSRQQGDDRRRRYACVCGSKFTTIEMYVDVARGRPGMTRKGATVANFLRKQLQQEAEQAARARLRELLG